MPPKLACKWLGCLGESYRSSPVSRPGRLKKMELCWATAPPRSKTRPFCERSVRKKEQNPLLLELRRLELSSFFIICILTTTALQLEPGHGPLWSATATGMTLFSRSSGFCAALLLSLCARSFADIVTRARGNAQGDLCYVQSHRCRWISTSRSQSCSSLHQRQS